VFLALAPSSLCAQDAFILFGGYSYLRPPISVEESSVSPSGQVCTAIVIPPTIVTNRQNLNGWELSAIYRFLPFLGLVADFSGHYGASISSSTSKAHQYTYLFGPELSLPSRASPFAHVLFGFTNQSILSGTLTDQLYNSTIAASNSAFATAIGAGVDLKVVPHIWIRPIQIDYLLTRLSGSTQNQVRVSAGVVFHF